MLRRQNEGLDTARCVFSRACGANINWLVVEADEKARPLRSAACSAQQRFSVRCAKLLRFHVDAALDEDEFVMRKACRRLLASLEPKARVAMHHRAVRKEPLSVSVVPEANDRDFDVLIDRVPPFRVAIDFLRFVHHGEEVYVGEKRSRCVVEGGVDVKAARRRTGGVARLVSVLRAAERTLGAQR